MDLCWDEKVLLSGFNKRYISILSYLYVEKEINWGLKLEIEVSNWYQRSLLQHA